MCNQLQSEAMPAEFEHSEFMRKAYLGKLASELILVASEQVERIYRQRGLTVPVETSSVLHFIGDNPGSTSAQICRALDLPHQLVGQRLKKLDKHGCLTRQGDPEDARRTLLELTPHGQDQHRRLVQTMADTAVVYSDLYREIGCELPDVLAKAIEALRQKPLSRRFAETFHDEEAPQT